MTVLSDRTQFTARRLFLTTFRDASGRYGSDNLLEKIANTGHVGRRQRRHPGMRHHRVASHSSLKLLRPVVDC